MARPENDAELRLARDAAAGQGEMTEAFEKALETSPFETDHARLRRWREARTTADAPDGWTPGPWKADSTIYEHMVSEIRAILPGSERGIAQVWKHENGFADARLIAAAPDLAEAADALERAEDFNANDCRDCEGEGVPELCATCCPLFDDARVKRRLALAKARGQ